MNVEKFEVDQRWNRRGEGVVVLEVTPTIIRTTSGGYCRDGSWAREAKCIALPFKNPTGRTIVRVGMPLTVNSLTFPVEGFEFYGDEWYIMSTADSRVRRSWVEKRWAEDKAETGRRLDLRRAGKTQSFVLDCLSPTGRLLDRSPEDVKALTEKFMHLWPAVEAAFDGCLKDKQHTDVIQRLDRIEQKCERSK